MHWQCGAQLTYLHEPVEPTERFHLAECGLLMFTSAVASGSDHGCRAATVDDVKKPWKVSVHPLGLQMPRVRHADL